MLTPEVHVHTADFPQENKQAASNMSRRFGKRILILAFFGCAFIFLFMVFAVVRMPNKTSWKGAVQNMHIQDAVDDHDYQNGINLEEAENVDDDEAIQDDLLIHRKGLGNKVIDEGVDYDDDHLGTNEDEIDYDNNDKIADQNNNKQAEYDKSADDTDDDNNNFYDDEFNNNNNDDMQRENNINEKMKNFTLPPEFFIKNNKGEVIGVKHFPNGMPDLIKWADEIKNKKESNDNKLPLNENGLARGTISPFLENNVKADGARQARGRQGGLGAHQGGLGDQDRFGAQQGRLGDQQGRLGDEGEFGAQQGGLGAQRGGLGDRGGFGAQQGGLGAQQGRLGAQRGGLGNQRGGLGAQRGGFDDQGEFDAQQGGLDAQGGGLGAQQGGLGARQGVVGAQQGGLGAQRGGLGAQQRGLGAQGGGLGTQQGGLGSQQRGLGAQQGGLGVQQGRFGAQQGGLGAQQGGFGAQQGRFGAQQGGLGAQQKGFDAQQAGFGVQQKGFGAQQGGIEEEQKGFGAQQGRLGDHQAGGNPRQLGQNNLGGQPGEGNEHRPRTFNEFLRDQQNKNQFNNPEAFQRLPGQLEDNNNQDTYLGNKDGDIQNEKLDVDETFPANAKGGRLDNNVENNLNLLKKINPLLKNRNNAMENKFVTSIVNNSLANMNPLLRAKKLLQNQHQRNGDNIDEPQNINQFIPANNLSLKPHPLNQDDNDMNDPEGQDLDNNKFMEKHEFHDKHGLNNQLDSQLLQNEDELIGQDDRQEIEQKNKYQENKQHKEATSSQEKQDEENQPEIVANNANLVERLLQQHIYMEDLTAPVSIQAKCINYRFPTGSGPLCIHSADADPLVSGKIEAGGIYEAKIMNQMLFILSNDTSLGFVDIGAHIGVYSMAAAHMNRKVLAVEPLKINCQLFHKNAVENHVTHRIVLLRHALDNHTYDGLTEVSNSSGGYSNVDIFKLLSDIDLDQTPDRDKAVHVTTLNKIVPAAQFQRALLKMDVNNGMEVNILDASSEFFKAIDVPYILTHWTVSKRLPMKAQMRARLFSLGYRPKLSWDGPDEPFGTLNVDHHFLVWKKQ